MTAEKDAFLILPKLYLVHCKGCNSSQINLASLATYKLPAVVQVTSEDAMQTPPSFIANNIAVVDIYITCN